MALVPDHVLATEIVLIVETTVTVTDQAVDVRLVVSNNGDEDALAVTPFLALGGVETGLEARPHIAFRGGRRVWTHRFPVSDLLIPEAGAYPLVVRLRYHDAHMYPYSMVSATRVQIGESHPETAPLAGAMSAAQVADEETLDLRVRNTGSLPHEARITMVSPTELIVAGDSGKLNIPAGEERQISYVTRNNGSLPGSNHTVLALVEYSSNGQHGVVIAAADVAIASDISSKKTAMIIAGAGFIVLLFFVVLFIEFRIGARVA